MAIRAGAEEADQIDAVAPRELLQTTRKRQLVESAGQVKAVRAHRGGNVREERVDRVDAHCSEHPLAVAFGLRSVGHESKSGVLERLVERDGQPAATSWRYAS